MSQSVAIPVVARFDPDVEPERRRDLVSRLALPDVSPRTGLDLGELVSLPSIPRPAAVLAFVGSAASLGEQVVRQTADAARAWLAGSQPLGAVMEIELPGGVVFRLSASTPDLAIRDMDETWQTMEADEPVAWSDQQWTPLSRTAPAAAAAPAASAPLSGAPCILSLDTDWSSAKGGISTVNRHLCMAMAAAGAKVYCVVLRATREEIMLAAAGGVVVMVAEPVPWRHEDTALSRRPKLPEGVIPDVVIGHGRVTGPDAQHIVEEHFPGARRVHMVHSIPDEVEWEKAGTRHIAGERAKRTREELDLLKSAALAVGIGPRIYALLSGRRWSSTVPRHRISAIRDLTPPRPCQPSGPAAARPRC
ncbi:glycosyltransferase family 4 protein [Streptacidiphilus sp. 4-A2]|nr:glycosyltransferase family 4 protein [Streptacidiphilus sp. 4-A2]